MRLSNAIQSAADGMMYDQLVIAVLRHQLLAVLVTVQRLVLAAGSARQSIRKETGWQDASRVDWT